MAAPTLVVRYTTDDASDSTPTWTDVTSYVRSFSTSRGRADELADVDAGTATIVLNNRTRQWDPTSNSLLRPMNRWNIRATLPNATTEDIFLGYAESYEQQWPGVGLDAVTVVNCADEFKVLALDKLPATDPPRETYQDLVMFDQPTGYWPMNVDAGNVAAVVGEPLVPGNGNLPTASSGAIVGQAAPQGSASLTATRFLQTPVLTTGLSGEAGALSEFTIEAWIASSGTPASTELLISGPQGIPSHTFTWKLSLNTSNKYVFQVKNAAGTTHTCTSTTSAGSFQHVVGTITGAFVRLYVNGTQEASTAWTGTIEQCDNGFTMIVGNAGTTISTNVRVFDEMAFYRTGLTAARVLAHYTAGTARGFVVDQTGDRITAILASIGSIAPQAIQQGGWDIIDTYMVGQDPLSEIRRAESVESIDSVFFIAKDGTITYLDWQYRATSPYTIVQALFGDLTGTTRTNRVTNPSFETNTTSWASFAGGGTLTRVTSDFVYGLACLKYDMVAVGNGAVFTSATGQAVPALTSLTASVSFKGTAGQSFECQMLGTNTDASVFGGVTSFVATGAWQRVENTVAVPAGKTGDVVKLLVYKRSGVGANTPGADTFYLDGAQIEIATAATAYFDGDLGGYWTGTAHASNSISGGELPYQDITIDYSDSFIANEWNLTADGDTTATASDATSISKYLKRSKQLNIPLSDSGTDAVTIAAAMLAKYKDPLTRVTSLDLVAYDTTLINTVFTLDLADRIRVLRTPMGGGTRLDQTLFIQSIDVDGDPSAPWRIRLGVSPL